MKNDSLRILADALLAILFFLSAWMFNTITALPEKYVLKEDYKDDLGEVKTKLDYIIKQLNEKEDRRGG